MFCNAVMGALQAGQAERGTTRLKRSFVGGAAGSVAARSGPASSAHSSRHWRSIMIGTRWMTTLRKLPTTRPSTRQTPMNRAGDEARRAITDGLQSDGQENAARRAAFSYGWVVCPRSDDLTHLEDRQVHRDDEAADQHAENDHDQRL